MTELHKGKARELLANLAPAEHLGLAVMGAGCGDHAAAFLLGMELSSVRTLRRRIHGKLGLHDKEDLVQAAARLGYTRFTENGLEARGLAALISEYLVRSRRPAKLSQALLNLCGLDSVVLTQQLGASVGCIA